MSLIYAEGKRMMNIGWRLKFRAGRLLMNICGLVGIMEKDE